MSNYSPMTDEPHKGGTFQLQNVSTGGYLNVHDNGQAAPPGTAVCSWQIFYPGYTNQTWAYEKHNDAGDLFTLTGNTGRGLLFVNDSKKVTYHHSASLLKLEKSEDPYRYWVRWAKDPRYYLTFNSDEDFSQATFELKAADRPSRQLWIFYN